MFRLTLMALTLPCAVLGQTRPPLVLMNGYQGDMRPCPLCTQLGISAYPTLKLIDERGQIVWESTGLDERQLNALKAEIERRLPLTR